MRVNDPRKIATLIRRLAHRLTVRQFYARTGNSIDAFNDYFVPRLFDAHRTFGQRFARFPFAIEGTRDSASPFVTRSPESKLVVFGKIRLQRTVPTRTENFIETPASSVVSRFDLSGVVREFSVNFVGKNAESIVLRV